MADTISVIQTAFREIFDDEELEIARNTTADDVVGWDSLSNVRLMIRLEELFKIRLRASEVAELNEVGDLEDLIAEKMNGA